MAAFRFRFEAVLRQRREQERRCQLDVARLEHERAQVEEVIRGHQRGIGSARGDLRAHLAGGPVNLGGVRMQAAASLALVARAQRAVLHLAGVHARIGEAREKLLRAAVRRKAVEALRDRHLAAWVEAGRRADNAAADELTVVWNSRSEGVA
jgi:flagellar export protein FliJ